MLRRNAARVGAHPPETRGARRSAHLAVLLFAGGFVYAVVHLALGARYQGFGSSFSVAVDVGLAAIWGISALTLWRKWRALSLLPHLGAFTSLMHGAFYAMTDHALGLPFLIAAPILAVCVVRASRLFPSEGGRERRATTELGGYERRPAMVGHLGARIRA